MRLLIVTTLLASVALGCAKKEVERRDAPPRDAAADSADEPSAEPDTQLTAVEQRLADSLEGLDGEGAPRATIVTSVGEFDCDLFVDSAPHAVANFIELSRGKREWTDPETGEVRRDPLYRDLPFHRIEPGFLAETGDPTGTGKGGPGYEFADEIAGDLQHDRVGVLAMSNHGPDTNGSIFFVTLGKAPHLDGRHTIFGHCGPAASVQKLGESEETPMLQRIDVRRAAGD